MAANERAKDDGHDESLAAHEPARSIAPPGEQDGANFRLAMREFATGVAIVACGAGETLGGCTATAVSSLSLTPPSLIVCLDQQILDAGALRRAGAFSVNFLAARHRRLAASLRGARRLSGRGALRARATGRRSRRARRRSPTPPRSSTAASTKSSSATPTRFCHWRLSPRCGSTTPAPALLHWRGTLRDARMSTVSPLAPAASASRAWLRALETTSRATRDPNLILPRAVNQWAAAHGDAPALISSNARR